MGGRQRDGSEASPPAEAGEALRVSGGAGQRWDICTSDCLLRDIWAAGLHCEGGVSSSSESLGAAVSSCPVSSRHGMSHGAVVWFLGKGSGARRARVGPWGLLLDQHIKRVNVLL